MELGANQRRVRPVALESKPGGISGGLHFLSGFEGAQSAPQSGAKANSVHLSGTGLLACPPAMPNALDHRQSSPRLPSPPPLPCQTRSTTANLLRGSPAPPPPDSPQYSERSWPTLPAPAPNDRTIRLAKTASLCAP